MIIQHNMTALQAGNNLGKVTNNKNKAMERLSTGYRINRAADDAAGLSISEELRAQVHGLNRAALNTQDGMSLANVTDAGMQELHNVLHRVRELCVQSANDTNASTDRAVIGEEVEQLFREVDSIAETTQFNTIKVLQSEEESLGVQVGANTGELVFMELPKVSRAKLEQIAGDQVDVITNSQAASASLELVDKMIETVNEYRAKVGAFYNRLEHAHVNAENAAENQQSAESKIRDTDMADEMVTFSAQNILEQAGVSLLTQANSSTQGVVNLLQG